MSGDVAQECWKSCVPVQLRLSETEITTVEQPPVLYFLVPRHSYLLSLLPKALPLLQHVLPPGEDTPWMEHSSLPLKWNIPAGVLYDLLAGEGEVPWSLTLHFRGYPSTVLPAYGGEASIRASILNSLKEAAFVCRGSSIRVMEMSPGAQEDLYRAVLQQDLPLYRSVVQSLQLAPVARGGRQPAIPLRVYLRAGGRGYLSSYEGIAYTSRFVECQHPGGTLVTLGEALQPLVSEYLNEMQPPGAASAKAEAPAEAVPAPPAAAGSSPGEGGAAAAAQQRGVGGAARAGGAGGEDAGGEGRRGEGGGGGEGRSSGEQVRDGGGSEGAELPTAGADRDGSISTPEEAPTRAAAEGQGQQAAPPSAAGAPDGLLRQVLVGGITPPLDTPVAWLHANMHAADMFLYVVVHVSDR